MFLIDSDLEEEPEWLPIFSAKMSQAQCDVVYGVQGRRKGDFFEQHTGKLFYLLFRLATGFSLPENLVTARLMTRQYVNSLLLHDEREVCLAGLWLITGFNQQAHIITKKKHSKSTYTLKKKVQVFVNSITAFSSLPLIGIFYFGISISFLSFIYILYLVINWFFLAKPISGWTSVMASIWTVGGLIMSFVGIIGIYLSKVFLETKRRPYTIVRKIYGHKIN